MKKIDLYILEKLKINKDCKTVDYKLNEWCMTIHKSIKNNEVFIYFEDIIKIVKIEEGFVKNLIEIKFSDEGFTNYESEFVTKEGHIFLLFGDKIDVEDLDIAEDVAMIVPKDEAIKFLKELKDNNYTFDWGKYFGNKTKYCVVYNGENNPKKINDEDIENMIKKLKS